MHAPSNFHAKSAEIITLPVTPGRLTSIVTQSRSDRTEQSVREEMEKARRDYEDAQKGSIK